MRELGYYNGRIGELSEMTVPMNDRACYFGDGVYDAQLCRNYRLFALDEHVDRFFNSAKMLDIALPLSKDELKALLNDLVRKLDTGDLFVYYQASRGTAPREHAFPDAKANLWVVISPRKVNEGREPIRLITIEDTRFLNCNIKTLNLLPSVIAAEKAKQAGCQECVFYRPGYRVTECAHSNVHILKDGTLFTAPLDNLILPGIARAHLIRMCGRMGIPVREEPYTLDALMSADEIFVTSSGNLIMRALEADGKKIGGRDPETFEKLRAALLDEFYTATA
ncbi:MAG: aminotransferase class IV [Clostridia bacterium]|nr:aminotransferase class IV [Clostridia bacterium]